MKVQTSVNTIRQRHTEDEDLVNSNTKEDIVDFDSVAESFWTNERQRFNEGIIDDRNFEFGEDGDTIWSNKPLHSKFSRIRTSNLVINLSRPKGEAKRMTN